jgi:glyoxalase family protein
MGQAISGIHHVTAIARDPQKNVDFYTEVLGLRLVKKTVNFDDPGTYHLYYGDELGRPGHPVDLLSLAAGEAGPPRRRPGHGDLVRGPRGLARLLAAAVGGPRGEP